MKRLKFDNKWIKWIKTCLKSTTISVLVNESPKEEFKLREVLSRVTRWHHFYSLLLGEGLIGLVQEARSKDLLEGGKMRGKGVNIDLLHFQVIHFYFVNLLMKTF